MDQILKADIINGAYSRARISGLTTVPGAEEVQLALDLLDSMMGEWFDQGYCVGYQAPDPDFPSDPGDPSGISQAHKYAVETALAVRLLDDFGKPITPNLQKNHSTSMSALASSVAVQEQTQYPNNMPRGSSNSLRWNRWNRYFKKTQNAPISCDTNTMDLGEIDSFIEDYSAYLKDGEFIDTFTVEAGAGLSVLSSALNSDFTIVSYTVEAIGSNDTAGPWHRVKITIITDGGRKDIRFVNFQLKPVEV